MSKYRTAQGKMLDMSALAAKNEKTRAVGNMRVNARGDTIDGTGKIIEPATSKVNKNYAKTVGNRSAQARGMTNKPIIKAAPIEEKLTELEKEFADTTQEDLEIEQIKKQTSKK